MNWLAHALLSENTSAFRLGNLLPDFLTATELAQLDPIFQPGMMSHRRIDAFTDQHPVVRRSVRRFVAYRRVAPVLVDVFYDHFLSTDWAQYSAQPLESFIAEVYGAFDVHRAQLPETLWPPLQRMRAEDWLGSYRDFAGLRRTLTRMERRFRRQVDLVGGVAELENNYADLRADFREFFPELRSAALTDRLKPCNPASVPTSL
ncbi:MAG: ACP phosphodiesterase [Verrucomicrobiota bacterium]